MEANGLDIAAQGDKQSTAKAEGWAAVEENLQRQSMKLTGMGKMQRSKRPVEDG